jgi:hypothetical protein
MSIGHFHLNITQEHRYHIQHAIHHRLYWKGEVEIAHGSGRNADASVLALADIRGRE